MTVPDPTHPYPLPAHERFCVFLRPTINLREGQGRRVHLPPPSSPATSRPIPSSAATPAALIKRRYSDADVGLLQQAAWWNWPIEIISAHASTLMAGTPAEISAIADQHVYPA